MQQSVHSTGCLLNNNGCLKDVSSRDLVAAAAAGRFPAAAGRFPAAAGRFRNPRALTMGLRCFTPDFGMAK